MYLSEIGEIVEQEWLKTPELRPDMNLSLGTYVVMPNHFHAILEIGRNQYNQRSKDAMHCVSPPPQGTFGVQRKNLSSVIRGFKSSVTTYARKHKIDFSWQPRFHESIIDDKRSYKNITNYINENPRNWENDSLF
ncbi:transposase [Sinomicrobium sp. M5D2P9]